MVNAHEYYAGLLDMQLTVAFRANKHIRVLLTSNESRVVDQVTAKFRPTKITTVRRLSPGRESCVIQFVEDDARPLLEFAAEHCLCRGALARAALAFLNGSSGVDDVIKASSQDITVPDTVPVEWVAGVFDVRGIVSTPPETKRGIKIAFPKHERALLAPIGICLPMGRVKKTSPCRLVFESRESIRAFLAAMDPFVEAKRPDLTRMERALSAAHATRRSTTNNPVTTAILEAIGIPADNVDVEGGSFVAATTETASATATATASSA